MCVLILLAGYTVYLTFVCIVVVVDFSFNFMTIMYWCMEDLGERNLFSLYEKH